MIKFYLDEMIARAVAEQLNRRSIETVLAHDMGMRGEEDESHLDFATEKGFVCVTFDRPFAGRIANASIEHGGLVCLSGMPSDIGYAVNTLAQFAEAHSQDDVQGYVFWL